MHVVLLGDSIFDNGVYVQPGEPDVAEQLAAHLGDDERVTLNAVDGATTRHVAAQLTRLPDDATHLVVSAGGNDALGQMHILSNPTQTVQDALLQMLTVQADFATTYAQMLAAVTARELPVALCTIYNPRYPEPTLQSLAEIALSIYNDVILRLAHEHRLPVLELRHICTADTDYANPIEPSAIGGEKIAAGIAQLLATHDFQPPRTCLYP